MAAPVGRARDADHVASGGFDRRGGEGPCRPAGLASGHDRRRDDPGAVVGPGARRQIIRTGRRRTARGHVPGAARLVASDLPSPGSRPRPWRAAARAGPRDGSRARVDEFFQTRPPTAAPARARSRGSRAGPTTTWVLTTEPQQPSLEQASTTSNSASDAHRSADVPPGTEQQVVDRGRPGPCQGRLPRTARGRRRRRGRSGSRSTRWSPTSRNERMKHAACRARTERSADKRVQGRTIVAVSRRVPTCRSTVRSARRDVRSKKWM